MDIETRQAKHIAMIMDGNRRYAKKLHLPAGVGHEKGAEKLSNVIKWCLEAEIKELTLYAFSMQNFHRKQEEVEGLFKLFRKHFAKLNDDKSIIEKKIRIKVVGRKHLFPNDIQESIAKIEEKTKQHDNLTINFAMAYGGREEIVDAARKIASEIKHNEITAEEIDNETFANHLYFKSDFWYTSTIIYTNCKLIFV